MKIKPGDSLNVAISKVCAGDRRAGNIAVILLREYPETTLEYLKAIDNKGLSGPSMADFYFRVCEGQLATFLEKISG